MMFRIWFASVRPFSLCFWFRKIKVNFNQDLAQKVVTLFFWPDSNINLTKLTN